VKDLMERYASTVNDLMERYAPYREDLAPSDTPTNKKVIVPGLYAAGEVAYVSRARREPA
jgi:hypothetical protein